MPRLRWGARPLAMAGSLLAHAAALIVSSTSAAVIETGPVVPRPPSHPTGAFVLHSAPFHWLGESSAWPPSEAVQACFSEAAVYPHMPPSGQTVEAFGYNSSTSQSWVRAAVPEGPGWPGPRPEDTDWRVSLFHQDLRKCATTAGNGGWSGEGRVFVRVTRETRDRMLVQALPLDDTSNDPGLLCCLRESQEMLAVGMRPGETLRYTFRWRDGGIDLTVPPR